MRTKVKTGLVALFWIAGWTLAAGAAPAQDLARLYQSGLEAFESGKVHEAIGDWETVAEADPGYRDVQLRLGQALLVAHRHREAQKRFERVLAAEPTNGHAAFLLGLALHRSARHFEAAEALERARELAPDNPHPRIYLGLSFLELGRPEEARAEIETALSLAPGEPTALVALAELELAAGRYAAAEGIVREILPTAPAASGLEARILLGRILAAAGRAAEAVPVFREAVALTAPRSDLLYLLAQALLRSGEAEAGRTTLARFKELKALEEEVKVLEAALSADPGDVETRIRLARLLLDHRRKEGAFPHVMALRSGAPDDPRVRALVAELNR